MRKKSSQKQIKTHELRIHFPGTGDLGFQFLEANESDRDAEYNLKEDELALNQSLKVASNADILYFKDCTHQATCNSLYDPDIKGFVEKIAKALVVDGDLVVRDMLMSSLNDNSVGVKEERLPDSVVRGDASRHSSHILSNLNYVKTGGQGFSSEQYLDDNTAFLWRGAKKNPKKYNFLRLQGHSRGAVTAFLLAKELHKLGVTVPISIYASEPVAGFALVRSWLKESLDLRHCSHIEFCKVSLGAHQFLKRKSYLVNKGIPKKDLREWADWLFSFFLIQSLPEFHENTTLLIDVNENKFSHAHAPDSSVTLDKPSDLNRIFGALTRRQIFSLAKKPHAHNNKSTSQGELHALDGKVLPQLRRFAMEIWRSTSFNYSLRVRSRRKEDHLKMIAYDLKEKVALTPAEIEEFIVEMYQTTLIKRGFFAPTSASAFSLLLKKEKYQDLNKFIKANVVLDNENIITASDKERHYATRNLCW